MILVYAATNICLSKRLDAVTPWVAFDPWGGLWPRGWPLQLQNKLATAKSRGSFFLCVFFFCCNVKFAVSKLPSVFAAVKVKLSLQNCMNSSMKSRSFEVTHLFLSVSKFSLLMVLMRLSLIFHKICRSRGLRRPMGRRHSYFTTPPPRPLSWWKSLC